jgi:hypothetical protein
MCLAGSTPAVLPSVGRKTSAQYLACALPCERFTSALAGIPCITRGRCGSLLLHREGGDAAQQREAVRLDHLWAVPALRRPILDQVADALEIERPFRRRDLFKAGNFFDELRPRSRETLVPIDRLQPLGVGAQYRSPLRLPCGRKVRLDPPATPIAASRPQPSRGGRPPSGMPGHEPPTAAEGGKAALRGIRRTLLAGARQS